MSVPERRHNRDAPGPAGRCPFMRAGGNGRPTIRGTATFLVLLLLSGCFLTLGDFDASNIRQLVIGATPRRTVDSLFGAPRETTTTGNAVLYTYAYSEQDPQPSTPRIGRKLLVVEFSGDTLHGYLYSSTVGSQTTEFREDLRDSVRERARTTADVLRYLGEPGGKALLPAAMLTHLDYVAPEETLPAGSREAWIYASSYSQRGALGSYHEVEQRLIVYVDSAGVITGSAPRHAEPDPFGAPSTEIRYRLDSTSCVTLEVYDMTGFLLLVPVLDEEQTAGNYTRTMELGDLPSGSYLVRIRIDSATTLRRIIFMR